MVAICGTDLLSRYDSFFDSYGRDGCSLSCNGDDNLINVTEACGCNGGRYDVFGGENVRCNAFCDCIVRYDACGGDNWGSDAFSLRD